MKPFIIAANWKMFKTPEQAESYFSQLKPLELNLTNKQLVFFAPAIDLVAVSNCCAGTDWGWGPQNTHFEDEGAYTGETSPAVVAHLGATHSLVGHSERRALFGETGEFLAKKMKALMGHGLVPILCIGETLEDRKSERTIDVLKKQLDEGLSGVPKDALFHIAYEPVWAIGTGEVASPSQVEEAHSWIFNYLKEHYETFQDMSILYGGSVKPENAEVLGSVANVSGFLVGSAGLNVDSFSGIVEAVKA